MTDSGWNPPAADWLAAWGWTGADALAFEPHAAAGLAAGRILVEDRGRYQLATAAGEQTGGISGRFRYDALDPSEYPALGDWVAYEGRIGASVETTIRAVLPRRSAIVRGASESGRGGQRANVSQVLAANVDVAFIVAALNLDFSLRRLERYLGLAWSSGVQPVVLLNKADLCADVPTRIEAVERVAPGVPVEAVSALHRDGLDRVAIHLLPGRTAIVLGSSGVGKSTLVNALTGSETMDTGAIRDADSRGRHTTSHRELLALPDGALLIDTPGLRSLELADGSGLNTAFADIAAIAADCRFSDCAHEREPGCAVRVALDDGRLDFARLENLRKIEREIERSERQADPRARADQRAKRRRIQTDVKSRMRAKYGD
jgi:ribosome biogenesis GTPase / thiamine phosphate phosphatase